MTALRSGGGQFGREPTNSPGPLRGDRTSRNCEPKLRALEFGFLVDDQRGVDLVYHDGAIDDALLHVAAAREVVHHFEQHLFEDRTQSAGAGPRSKA